LPNRPRSAAGYSYRAGFGAAWNVVIFFGTGAHMSCMYAKFYTYFRYPQVWDNSENGRNTPLTGRNSAAKFDPYRNWLGTIFLATPPLLFGSVVFGVQHGLTICLNIVTNGST